MSTPMMTALRRVDVGTADLRQVPVPAATGTDEILIRLTHAAVNPFDMQVLRGEIGADPTRALTLGAEGVGTVDGELVLVTGKGLGAVRDGLFAPWAVVPAEAIHHLPAGIDPRQAACVGVAGKTAWRAVHKLAQVNATDTVLVLGAGGGVGQFAAQLARAAGARVLAHSGSAARGEWLESLGLTPVIAPTPDNLAQQIESGKVSVVLDPLGDNYVSTLLPILASSARVVTYGVLAGRTGTFDLGTLYGKGIRIIGTSGGTTPPAEASEAMQAVLRAISDNDVHIAVESRARRLRAPAGPSRHRQGSPRSLAQHPDLERALGLSAKWSRPEPAVAPGLPAGPYESVSGYREPSDLGVERFSRQATS